MGKTLERRSTSAKQNSPSQVEKVEAVLEIILILTACLKAIHTIDIVFNDVVFT